MRNRYSKKMICLVAAAAILTGGMAVKSAYAYFTTYSSAKGSVEFNLGYTKTILNETVENGQKIVSIENTGDYDCYVRVRAYAGADYQKDLSYADGGSGNWYDGNDGYWYYKKILPKGESTENLNINIPEKLFNDLKDDQDLNVIVIQECTPVQYGENGEAYADWNAVFPES